MADIEGLGKCGVCYKPIVPGQPIRHWQGYQMSHKDCHDKEIVRRESDEYKLQEAFAAVETAKRKVIAAQYELEVAEIKLARLVKVLQQE